LLNIIKSMAGVDGLAKVFDVNADGSVVPLIDAGEDSSAEELMKGLTCWLIRVFLGRSLMRKS
jgi:hypothetical protein